MNLLCRIDPQFEREMLPSDIEPTIEYLLHLIAMHPTMPGKSHRKRTIDIIHAKYRDGKSIAQICEEFGFATRAGYYDTELKVISAFREPDNKEMLRTGIQKRLISANKETAKATEARCTKLQTERCAAFRLGYHQGKADRSNTINADDFPIKSLGYGEIPNVFVAPVECLDLPVKTHLALKKADMGSVGDVILASMNGSLGFLAENESSLIEDALKKHCGVELPVDETTLLYIKCICD